MTRKSQYGWMVVGGILCLCGGVVALKLREGNPAVAQTQPAAPPLKDKIVMHEEKAAADPSAGPSPKAPSPDELPAPVAPPEPMPRPVSPAEALPPLPAGEPKLASPEPAAPTVAVGPSEPPPPPVAPEAKPEPKPVEPSAAPKEPPPPAPPAAAPDAAPPSEPLPNLPAGTADKTSPPTPSGSAVTARLLADHAEKSAPPGSIEPPPPAPPGSLEPPPPAPPTVTRAEVVKVTAPTILQVGEPPLAGAGPIQSYQVRHNGETMRDIARRTLGAGERCTDVYKLNPELRPEDTLSAGTQVHLPPDACLPVEEVEGLKPLPAMRPKTAPVKTKSVLALTGTYPCNIDDKRTLTLPRAVREQFADADLVLASPGPDQCLWLTDQAHQERLAERLERSPAREADVRVFKRLYFAQTERLPVTPEGRIAISDRLTQFAGLSQEVVLVGIDDHFEVWDAARWKAYTQAKSAAAVAGSE